MTAVERTKVAEKVGIIAVDDSADRVDVVEYSVCPPELATAADSQGQPIFKLAHINTNLVKLDSINADLPPTLYSGKRYQSAADHSHKFPRNAQSASGKDPTKTKGWRNFNEA